MKSCGVPLGARIVFRLQWAPFIVMSILLLLTLPFIFIVWVFRVEAAQAFIDGVNAVLVGRAKAIAAHRERVIALYSRSEA